MVFYWIWVLDSFNFAGNRVSKSWLQQTYMLRTGVSTYIDSFTTQLQQVKFYGYSDLNNGWPVYSVKNSPSWLQNCIYIIFKYESLSNRPTNGNYSIHENHHRCVTRSWKVTNPFKGLLIEVISLLGNISQRKYSSSIQE